MHTTSQQRKCPDKENVYEAWVILAWCLRTIYSTLHITASDICLTDLVDLSSVRLIRPCRNSEFQTFKYLLHYDTSDPRLPSLVTSTNKDFHEQALEQSFSIVTEDVFVLYIYNYTAHSRKVHLKDTSIVPLHLVRNFEVEQQRPANISPSHPHHKTRDCTSSRVLLVHFIMP